MPLILYPIVLITAVLLFYHFGGIKKNDDKRSIQQPAVRETPKFAYQVYLQNKEKRLIKVFENDNIGAVGYEIYSKYVQAMDAVDILVKNNKTNQLLLIVKDDSTECSFCVDHPDTGYMGMLSFEVVAHLS